MVLMLAGEHSEESVGYTHAVDWWSLGVTIYKLLVNAYPFKVDFRSVPEDANTERREKASQSRYAALTQPVNYYPLRMQPTAVQLIARLLVVDESRRLGFGSMGSQEVSSHPYFESIDWVRLEKKQLPPPPIPEECRRPPNPNALEPKTLSDLLYLSNKMSWLKMNSKNSEAFSVASAKSQNVDVVGEHEFENWDYTSPAAVMMELGHIACPDPMGGGANVLQW
jgi:serine/threonine protein kinase